MEVVKAMLHDQYLPMHLWAEATRTVVYVQNSTPHRLIDNKTPEEASSGEKPEVNHLRIYLFPGVHTYPKGEKDQDRSF